MALFRKVLGPQNVLVKVKYFIARVQPSPSDPNVNVRQETYMRALQAHCPLVEFYYGHFLRHRTSMEHANPPPASVEVWKNEEKGNAAPVPSLRPHAFDWATIPRGHSTAAAWGKCGSSRGNRQSSFRSCQSNNLPQHWRNLSRAMCPEHPATLYACHTSKPRFGEIIALYRPN